MTAKPLVFIDTDVLIAAAASASTHSASTVVLTLLEITLIDCICSQQVVTEGERNITRKMPSRLPEFQLLIHRCLRIVDDPQPNELAGYSGWADSKDLPLLVAAYREACTHFVTFNTRHYFPPPGGIEIMRPGDFLSQVRLRLSGLL